MIDEREVFEIIAATLDVRKDGEQVELDVYSFLATTPNELVATIHPKRMPVLRATKVSVARA